MPFVPGQLVKCVNGGILPVYGEELPTKGVVYTVRCVRAYGSGVFGVRLIEIVNVPRPYTDGYAEAFFNARAFAPIDDKALDIFRQVPTDAPQDVETV